MNVKTHPQGAGGLAGLAVLRPRPPRPPGRRLHHPQPPAGRAPSRRSASSITTSRWRSSTRWPRPRSTRSSSTISSRDIEGTYIFPVPEGASVSDFAMYIGDERVQGEILDSREARRIYEDIVRRMRDPGLLEYMGRNLFRARVFPIPANGEKRVQISYTEVLKAENGLVRYLYPLNTERFSRDPLEDVSISVRIESQVPIVNVYSPIPQGLRAQGRPRAGPLVGYEEKRRPAGQGFRRLLLALQGRRRPVLHELGRARTAGISCSWPRRASPRPGRGSSTRTSSSSSTARAA